MACAKIRAALFMVIAPGLLAGWISTTCGCQSVDSASSGQSSAVIAGLVVSDDQVVAAGSLVTLTATSETSAAGASITWTQLFGPSVDFGSGRSESISFIAPEPPREQAIQLIFEIVWISDGVEQQSTVNVTVEPELTILFSEVEDDEADSSDSSDGEDTIDEAEELSPPAGDESGDESTLAPPPNADAGIDLLVASGDLVMLDGSGSDDPNGGVLTYAWSQASGETVELSDRYNEHAWFIAPELSIDGLLVFALSADNGSAAATDQIVVIVQAIIDGASLGPTADAGSNQDVVEGEYVELDGAASSAAGDGVLTYTWSQIAGPAVELVDGTEAVAGFVAPQVEEPGAVVLFELTVAEEGLESSDLVEISVSDGGAAGDGSEELGEGEGEGDDEYVPLVPAGTNVALGFPTTFTVAPNYGLTTGSSDPQDLTDGEVYTGPNALWTDQGTVGWSGADGAFGLHIDLGHIHPIDMLTLDTGGGSSGAYMPASAMAYVSDDGVEWQYLTNLMAEATEPQDAYVQHRFVKANLHTRGRHVAVYFSRTGAFVFVDELEIITGDFDPAGAAPGGIAIGVDQLTTDVSDRFPLAVEQTSSLHLVAAAERAVGEVTGGNSAEALAELADVRVSILATVTQYGNDRADGLPYTPLDEQTSAGVGRYMTQAGLPPVSVWVHSTASGGVQPFDRPSGTVPVLLAADMMTNEHEHASFCVSNNTDQTVTVTISVADADLAPTVALSESFFVLAPGYRFVADALPKLVGDSLTLPPGMTKEVWLSIDSKNASAASYTRSIEVVPSMGSPVELTLTIDVYSSLMPDNPELLTAVFAYFALDGFAGHEEQAALDLSEHYANAHTLTTAQIPVPTIDSAGVPVLPDFDFAALDENLDRMPNVRLWTLFVSVKWRPLGTMITRGSAADEAVFKDWILVLRNHLADKGVSTDQWALWFVDEPSLDEWNDYIVPASLWTREADPDVLIWQNWNNSEVENAAFASDDVADFFAPSVSRLYDNTEQVLDFFESRNMPGWKYDSFGHRGRDPYQWFRLMQWEAWNWGLAGNGKWIYMDTGDGDVWNDFGGSFWGMVYPSPDGPIGSKRWEAWRDGIEDYELMRILAQAAGDTGDPNLIELLEITPQAVLDNPDNRSVLNALRLEILQALDD